MPGRFHPVHLSIYVLGNGTVTWRMYSTRFAHESGPLIRWDRRGHLDGLTLDEVRTEDVLLYALSDVLERLNARNDRP